MENLESPTHKSRLSIPAAIAFGLLLLSVDFAAKSIADARLPLNQLVRTPLPFFSWRLTYNTGSHYLLGAVGEVIPYRLMMGIAMAAVLGLIAYMARETHHMPPSPLRTVQWFIVAGLIGALGNALEVLVRGRATDYFMIHPFPWPANLCDQFVNAVIFVLLPLSMILSWRSTVHSTADPEPPTD